MPSYYGMRGERLAGAGGGRDSIVALEIERRSEQGRARDVVISSVIAECQRALEPFYRDIGVPAVAIQDGATEDRIWYLASGLLEEATTAPKPTATLRLGQRALRLRQVALEQRETQSCASVTFRRIRAATHARQRVRAQGTDPRLLVVASTMKDDRERMEPERRVLVGADVLSLFDRARERVLERISARTVGQDRQVQELDLQADALADGQCTELIAAEPDELADLAGREQLEAAPRPPHTSMRAQRGIATEDGMARDIAGEGVIRMGQ